MGEAWSDWYAMDYLVDKGYVTDTPAVDGQVVEGEYATDEPLRGIRSRAIDCPTASTAPGCAATKWSAHAGGYTYGEFGKTVGPAGADADRTYPEVHQDGEIWAETLWDLRGAVGAPTARGLITGGMRLSPVNPTFLDMRNAILQQSRVPAAGA